uniref:AlNc14C80G5254 protein n=1 Tax=Albugo laibachii Nc14 TaxID=890382 RepID=F0WF60_9STRA|nr:AlNc14C80G5254 [Albugo laibachii Nc14]|eukprot:CCA19842.1 AlNc14C80G5254 [Albugo laibachii Nc14]
MSRTDSKSPYIGCGGMVGGVHQCPSCFVNSFFGTPLGKKVFGQPVRCPRCETQTVLTPDLSSPIVAAFAHGLCAAEPAPSKTCPSRLTQAPSPSPPPLRDTETNPRQGKRSLQSMSTIAQRVKVFCWLADKEEKGGCSKASLLELSTYSETSSIRRRAKPISRRQRLGGRVETPFSALRGSHKLPTVESGHRKKHWWDEFERLSTAGLKVMRCF